MITIFSQNGLSCTNCFSFTIVRDYSNGKYIIVDKISGLNYAEYNNENTCLLVFSRLKNAIKYGNNFCFPSSATVE